MGRPKKILEAPKPEKKKVYKLQLFPQSKKYSSQQAAREAAIKILETGEIYFFRLDEVEV